MKRWSNALHSPDGIVRIVIICQCWLLSTFEEREKLEYPEKNLSEQEPTIHSTHI